MAVTGGTLPPSTSDNNWIPSIQSTEDGRFVINTATLVLAGGLLLFSLLRK